MDCLGMVGEGFDEDGEEVLLVVGFGVLPFGQLKVGDTCPDAQALGLDSF